MPVVKECLLRWEESCAQGADLGASITQCMSWAPAKRQQVLVLLGSSPSSGLSKTASSEQALTCAPDQGFCHRRLQPFFCNMGGGDSGVICDLAAPFTGQPYSSLCQSLWCPRCWLLLSQLFFFWGCFAVWNKNKGTQWDSTWWWLSAAEESITWEALVWGGSCFQHSRSSPLKLRLSRHCFSVLIETVTYSDLEGWSEWKCRASGCNKGSDWFPLSMYYSGFWRILFAFYSGW